MIHTNHIENQIVKQFTSINIQTIQQIVQKNYPKQLKNKQQIFHVTGMFLMLQKPHTNKHYAAVVLMKK